ncbi:MAG: murein biosynthesis integral membrane protein MurJ [Nitrospirota bacterium]|nr:murein biosynthesis integral membrane protein MurJ [Nitrospirota bacterium]MDH5585201.1 murein biosynthesis integral membrane protein MurJ [Nitrospirota bacterium]MDH5773504.1 murein biosynthesis integral membrane protein MurJ [Nitrospirota bacterium]
MTQSTTPPSDSQLPQDSPGETHQISRAAGLIGAATFCSRILGFLRDIILANLFGANAAADAFYIAYRIPNLLRELFAEGSMSSAFIPVFTEYHSTRSKQETWELASAAFTTLLTLVTLVTLLGILAAPSLVWMLAPGLHDEAAQLATTTLLTQIMFPYLLFVSLAALAMGVLNSLRSFAIPALAPVFFNVCVIVFALAISPWFDQPIVAVAIGIVVGGLAQFLMQLPGLHKKGFLFSWNFHPSHPGVKRMGVLLIPTLLGLAVTQINLTISTILASYFEGGPTYLFYAMRLIQFPLGIFGVAMATAILPSLSSHAAKGAHEELRATVNFGLRMVFFIILPSMVGLMLLRTPIIHLFFEHGAFSALDTIGTASALLGFSVGLWAFASYRILAMAFYSLQDTRTPATVAVVSVGINIGLSLWLMTPLAHSGLALAAALAAIANTLILATLLGRRLQGLLWATLGSSLARTGIALLPVIGLCTWMASFPIWQETGQSPQKMAWLLVVIGGSAIGYFGIHQLLHSDELMHLKLMLKRRLPQRSAQ